MRRPIWAYTLKEGTRAYGSCEVNNYKTGAGLTNPINSIIYAFEHFLHLIQVTDIHKNFLFK